MNDEREAPLVPPPTRQWLLWSVDFLIHEANGEGLSQEAAILAKSRKELTDLDDENTTAHS